MGQVSYRTGVCWNNGYWTTVPSDMCLLEQYYNTLVDREGDPSLVMVVVGGGGQG